MDGQTGGQTYTISESSNGNMSVTQKKKIKTHASILVVSCRSLYASPDGCIRKRELILPKHQTWCSNYCILNYYNIIWCISIEFHLVHIKFHLVHVEFHLVHIEFLWCILNFIWCMLSFIWCMLSFI